MLTLITGPTVEPVTVAEARAQLRLDSAAGEPAPTAPTVGLVTPAVAGNVDNGSHRYRVTFVTADGETEGGATSGTVAVVDKAVNGKVAVSGIPVGGAAVTSRRLYRTAAGGSTYLLLATLADNSTTTYTDNVADASLGAEAPSVNTTSDPEIGRFIAAARDRAEVATQRAILTQTWELVRDAFPAEDWIELPRPPLVSVTSVKYRDAAGALQTWGASNYVVEAPAGPRCRRGRISLAYGIDWPSTYGQAGDVTIRFVCGWATPSAVPPLLRTAMLLDIATMEAQREQVITGTIVAELPGGSRDIYRSFRSYATQGGV